MALIAEQVILDELGDNWRDRNLNIPPLAEDRGVDRHVLPLELELNGEWTDLLHLRDVETDWKGHLVPIARIPVDQHIRRSANGPTVRKKVVCEVLQIHLAGLLGPIRPPAPLAHLEICAGTSSSG
jgi:hypothetical protein